MVPATFLPKQMQLRFFAKASGHLRSYGKGCPPGTTKRWENFPTFRFFCFSIDLPTLIALRHSTFDSVLKACRKSTKNHSKKISCLSAEFKKNNSNDDRILSRTFALPTALPPRPASETSAPHRNPRWIRRSETSELEEVFFG